MADELGLPGIPEASPEDPEDVSWALSTAEAMWARGDHLEGIKWVRRAAEAASEAERDERALHLAKAAADLSGMLTRRSAVASHELDSPPPPPAGLVGSVRPAVPLPSKIGQAPKGSAAPRPAAAAASLGGIRAPAAPKPVERKGKRRSRENLENEARAAALMGSTSPSLNAPPASVTNPGGPPISGSADDTAQVPVLDKPVEMSRVRRSAPPPAEPSREELTSSDLGSAEYWDASPTQNLTSEELGAIGKRSEPPRAADSDRSTVIGAPPSAKPVSMRPPPSVRCSMRPPASTQHDPAIRTSQAVRVMVWRDANGVHIAPEGSAKIAALTIDAVLVALDPAADLTAWLSQRD